MKPFNIFIILSVLVILVGFVFFKNGFNKTQSAILKQDELLLDVPGYLKYNETNFSNAKQKGKSVLFFAATTWCQTCAELEKEIIERGAEIPKDVTILKVDYDNDRAMKQKYGVTTQHTLIVLDKNGKEVKRLIGIYFDTLLQGLKKV